MLSGFFCAGLNAQIPAQARFQPSSYAHQYRPVQRTALPNTIQMQGRNVDELKTEWEKVFLPQEPESVLHELPAPQPYEVPHLTFTYNHWSKTFHVVPYEQGYAANPAAFPKQTSPMHIWVSSQSSVSQPSPQVPYMSYHDPDPVILPAEIRMRGTRFIDSSASSYPSKHAYQSAHVQPIPMPVPRPATAAPIYGPARTRIGQKIQQVFGPFTVN